MFSARSNIAQLARVSIGGEFRFAVRKWKNQTHHEGHGSTVLTTGYDDEVRKIILGMVGRRPRYGVCGWLAERADGFQRWFSIAENLNPIVDSHGAEVVADALPWAHITSICGLVGRTLIA